MHTILVVDDAPENLTVLGELLQPHFRVRVAASGARALQAARTDPRPDLILLDVMMPDMDGYAVLAKLRAEPTSKDVPVIFVTAMDGFADEERGLAAGAVDYITKPIQPAIVLARVRTHLELKEARDVLANQNAFLEAEVQRRMAENTRIQEVSIHALAGLAEVRDPETGHHLLRTQGYVRTLAHRLQGHPRFAAVLTDAMVETIVRSAPLHDIGKVGIPDSILLKPRKLTIDEFTVMKTHAALGSEALARASGERGHVQFLEVAQEIARSHHERWDGGGYPDGLASDAIPVSARLMALADVFDALTSRRVYKDPMPLEAATRLIVDGRAKHFDPDVVDAFIAEHTTFAQIAARYADTAELLEAKAEALQALAGGSAPGSPP